jgi:hypothetical protein
VSEGSCCAGKREWGEGVGRLGEGARARAPRPSWARLGHGPGRLPTTRSRLLLIEIKLRIKNQN